MFHETAFHLMRVVLQEHGARWTERLPDLTKPQYAVLKALAGTDGLDQKALGEVSATTKATLAEMLGRMETRGLIERRADTADARRRVVLLTPAGSAKLAEARIVADALEREMLGVLPEADVVGLADTLTRLRAAIRASTSQD
ncbi:MarR family winged helix-turn-helix transcriptional regulator [Curtobacterium sp. ISL-83]|uniref:MarR family winged helix-turn-helix transcriptional regulator n=1 Tax=Curtobacterium sp. ISL-83 TaxID=2819145 RepID=UPI001BEC74AC|nr:MarR family winged helix-turn-helix transcriptional regulator [Curtobacterium sp. ISL-83]MBT2502881.1 winged helix-turn-helix transcriptional regulator [Curtobacterium sp. ISL-83]